jgi:formylglycine-generating enzyme required for sulfatase activity
MVAELLLLTLTVTPAPAVAPPAAPPPAATSAAAPAASPDQPAPGAVHAEPRSGLSFAYQPSGSFEMGCSTGDRHCDKDELPTHTEQVAGFWLGTTEVTVEAYGRCLRASQCTAPDTTKERCNDDSALNHPANCVDQTQASAFCAWVGGRLPTGIEWEYAAKGGLATAVYPWGSEDPTGRASYYAGEGTKPVGSFDKGKSRWGLQDMAGNVWEWTTSHAESGNFEVRGGGWFSPSKQLRTSMRVWLSEGFRSNYIGFRCVRASATAPVMPDPEKPELAKPPPKGWQKWFKKP